MAPKQFEASGGDQHLQGYMKYHHLSNTATQLQRTLKVRGTPAGVQGPPWTGVTTTQPETQASWLHERHKAGAAKAKNSSSVCLLSSLNTRRGACATVFCVT